jgi:hypothetical protein
MLINSDGEQVWKNEDNQVKSLAKNEKAVFNRHWVQRKQADQSTRKEKKSIYSFMKSFVYAS